MDMRWIGIVLMGGFTLLWASWAFGAGSAWMSVLGGVYMTAGVCLLVCAVAAFRRARRSPEPSQVPPGRRRPGILSIALFLEFLAIFIAVQIVRHVDTDLIQPVIALIVGAHFCVFWFSRHTRNALHLAMTAAGLTIGAAGFAGIFFGSEPAAVHAWVGIGMATITVIYGALFMRLLSADNTPSAAILD